MGYISPDTRLVAIQLTMPPTPACDERAGEPECINKKYCNAYKAALAGSIFSGRVPHYGDRRPPIVRPVLEQMKLGRSMRRYCQNPLRTAINKAPNESTHLSKVPIGQCAKPDGLPGSGYTVSADVTMTQVPYDPELDK